MKTGVVTVLLGLLVIISSLLAGVYIDLIVHKVSSWNEIIDAFGVHLDFARPEKWQGYFVDIEASGEAKVHSETVDLTSFVHSQRVIGSATDPENLPSWEVTGYVKSDAKYLIYTGADIGIGMYLLSASTKIKTKPRYSNTFFVGYRWGKNDEKFRKCPYVLIRDSDVTSFSITKDDLAEFFTPMSCEDVLFPALRDEKMLPPSKTQ